MLCKYIHSFFKTLIKKSQIKLSLASLSPFLFTCLIGLSCVAQDEIPEIEDMNDASLQNYRWQGWMKISDCYTTMIDMGVEVRTYAPCPLELTQAEDVFLNSLNYFGIDYNIQLDIQRNKTSLLSFSLGYPSQTSENFSITLMDYQRTDGLEVHEERPIQLIRLEVAPIPTSITPQSGSTSHNISLSLFEFAQNPNDLNGGITLDHANFPDQHFLYSILLRRIEQLDN